MAYNFNNNNNNQNKPKSSEEGGIDIRQLLQRIRKFWYIFLLLPMCTGGLAWAFLQYQVPVYEVKSTILIKDEKNKQGISATDLIAKEFGLSGNKKMLVDESKIMTSHGVIEKVVQDLRLDRVISLKGTLKNQELYGESCPIAIDSFVLMDTVKDYKASLNILDDKSFELINADKSKEIHTFNENFSNKYGSFYISRCNAPKYATNKELIIVCKGTEKTARELIKAITINLPKKESNMIEPSMRTTMPEKAKAILQRMVEVYNDYSLNDKKEISQNTLKFIDKRLFALTGELAGVEQNVEAYKTREGITADGAPNIGYFFNKLDEYDSELVKLEVQNSILTSIEGLLTKIDPTFDLLPTNLDIKSSNLQAQISEYNKMVLERNRLAKVAGEFNPTLKNLTLEINSLKRAIIDNIGRVKQENTSLLAQTQAKNTQYASKLGKNPRNERELTDIKRQQHIKEGLYLFLLQKHEETGISMVGAIADARVVERPIVGEIPVSTKKTIAYIMALAVGLFFSLLFVILQSLTIDTVQTEAELTAKTEMPILAKIPYSKTHDHWVVESGNQTMIAEMFRSLRNNLPYILSPNGQPSKGKMLMLTSTMSNEGKRFMTINLAMSLAIADRKTVIVNLDLRNPKLSFSFPTLKNSKGVSNYLTSDLYPHEIILQTGKHRDLFYVNSGTIPSNPSELMMSPKMGQLFTYLKGNFDYIIVNTPPIGLVSDALSLNSYVDMTLFVVRQGTTKKSDLSIINEYYESQKLPRPNLILNGFNMDDKRVNKYYNENLLTETHTSSNSKTNIFSKLRLF
jgi:tyrosine-protein kinase Etk/Wzc